KALQTLSEFLVLMQDTIAGFHEAGQQLATILKSDQTRFVLVSTLRSAPLRSAKHLAGQLKEMGFQLRLVLINRVIPEEVAESIKGLDEDAVQLSKASKICLRALSNTV